MSQIVSAMKRALDALECSVLKGYRQEAAIIDLRTAIEAAEKQAPVAWGILASNTGKMCSVVMDEDEVSEYDPKHIVPLYTAPTAPEVKL